MRGRGWMLAAVLAVPLVASCSGSSNGQVSQSTFRLKPGDCLVPPGQVKAELSSVTRVPCSRAHTQEVYALVKMSGAVAATDATYPGQQTLKQFADGQCEERYQGYVGVDYADSSLFFTYLLPSPRSWQADDRTVVCIVTTTGNQLTHSVRNSRL